VLETGQFERLSSSKARHGQAGALREDLICRLNLIELKLPPLAERRDDVPPLAEHFLAGRARFAEAAHEALLAHRTTNETRLPRG